MAQSITFYLPAFGSDQTDLKFLPKLIARARTVQAPESLFYPQLLHLLGEQNAKQVSLASLTHPDPGSKNWLRADPVSFMQHLTICTMQGNHGLNLSEDEVSSLLISCNDLLAKDGLHLQATEAHVWHLSLESLPKIQTTPWEHILGQEIISYLPKGESQSYWRQLTTELQMLIYTSEVNANRRAQRLPTIDSLWFWGEGTLPENLGKKRHWDCLAGCDGSSKKLAKKYQIPYQPIEHIEPSILLQRNSCEEILVVYPLRDPMERSQIDNVWFQSILEGLSKKIIHHATLILDDGYQYELAARQFRRWWQIG